MMLSIYLLAYVGAIVVSVALGVAAEEGLLRLDDWLRERRTRRLLPKARVQR